MTPDRVAEAPSSERWSAALEVVEAAQRLGVMLMMHQPSTIEDTYCGWCGDPWPCDVRKLRDALDAFNTAAAATPHRVTPECSFYAECPQLAICGPGRVRAGKCRGPIRAVRALLDTDPAEQYRKGLVSLPVPPPLPSVHSDGPPTDFDG